MSYKLFTNLYSGVIYDSLIFDLKYEKPFLLNSKIKKVSGKNQNYVGPAFTCSGEAVHKPSQIKDHIRIEMFKEFFKGCFQIISTDGDDSVAHFGDISGIIAKKFGAEVPFLRPSKISGDEATDIQFITHAISWFKKNKL